MFPPSALSFSGVHQVGLPQQTVWKRPAAKNVFPGTATRLAHFDFQVTLFKWRLIGLLACAALG